MYVELSKLLLNDAPTPLVQHVSVTYYVDGNIFHDKLTGNSVMIILRLVNKKTVGCYSKNKNTVEIATYGYEFFLTVPGCIR